MTKRFTDIGKWQDEWFCELPNDLKLAWLYIIDNCSHAGIWKRNLKLLKYYCNCKLSNDDIEKAFKGRIIEFDNDKWFIPKFLKFQYPQGLHSNKPIIVSIRKEILFFKLTEIVKQSLGNDYAIIKQSLGNDSSIIKQSLGNDSSIIKDKDKYKYKDKDKDKDKNKKEGVVKGGKKKEFLKLPDLELIKITQVDHDKLALKLGIKSFHDYLHRLNDYIGSKGDRYKSHYYTILTWWHKDQKGGFKDATACTATRKDNKEFEEKYGGLKEEVFKV